MTDNTILELSRVSQAYGKQLVVRELSLTLKQGEIGCLLGESGCGKTTVLRTISGFEPVLEGEIRIAGKIVSSYAYCQPPAKRQIGMVFQDYALFPHLSIYENVAFGLRDLSKPEQLHRVTEALELVGLGAEKQRYPHEVSGGQQQRIALARALASRPKLLLMDEPFSNLDVTLRERLSMEVRDILKQHGTTALFVTHNQNEAFAVADRIGVMHNGEILQWSSAFQLYHQPANPQIAEFVGEGTLISGLVKTQNKVETNLGTLRGEQAKPFPPSSPVKLLVRPEDVIFDREGPLQAKVLRRHFRGANTLYYLLLDGGEQVQALMPSHFNHQPGARIGIRADIRHLVLFPL